MFQKYVRASRGRELFEEIASEFCSYQNQQEFVTSPLIRAVITDGNKVGQSLFEIRELLKRKEKQTLQAATTLKIKYPEQNLEIDISEEKGEDFEKDDQELPPEAIAYRNLVTDSLALIEMDVRLTNIYFVFKGAIASFLNPLAVSCHDIELFLPSYENVKATFVKVLNRTKIASDPRISPLDFMADFDDYYEQAKRAFEAEENEFIKLPIEIFGTLEKLAEIVRSSDIRELAQDIRENLRQRHSAAVRG